LKNRETIIIFLDDVGVTKASLIFQSALLPKHCTNYEPRMNSPVYNNKDLSCPEQKVFRWP